MTQLFKNLQLLQQTTTFLCLVVIGLSFSGQAQALPSFARQTGMACTTCHTQAFGPNLTSYGRQFKLNGYTWGQNESYLSRFGGMAMGSLTNTKKNDADFIAENVATKSVSTRDSNNNIALDQASAFYGGKVWEKLGALVQFTYDGIGNRFSLDNTDIRAANDAELLGQDLVYGVSFNNNPTVQDLWNTTPAWGFPYVGSSLARTPTAGPMIANLGGQVGGATLYSMINDTLLVEAGAYTSFARYAQKGMGQWDGGAVRLNGGAPYWRIALQKDWKGHYVSLGHFGFRSDIQPDPTSTVTDRYTDLGVDFNYQYTANPAHIYELKASYIREQQQLMATYANQGADRLNQQLGFIGVNGSYTYDQTYGLGLGYNYNHGNRDSTLNSYSINARPNSQYFTSEIYYVPFGKTASTGLPTYMNLRLSLQYVAYTQFDGAIKNYDNGVTGRSASDNNTLYFNTWLSF